MLPSSRVIARGSYASYWHDTHLLLPRLERHLHYDRGQLRAQPGRAIHSDGQQRILTITSVPPARQPTSRTACCHLGPWAHARLSRARTGPPSPAGRHQQPFASEAISLADAFTTVTAAYGPADTPGTVAASLAAAINVSVR